LLFISCCRSCLLVTHPLLICDSCFNGANFMVKDRRRGSEMGGGGVNVR
jgi:hypothetical protein